MIRLRDVAEDDLEILFEQQRDPAATAMGAVPARDHDAFMAHWTQRVLADEDTIVRTIDVDGQVAGHVLSWRDGDTRLVGYWLGREHWGRGIATAALTELLAILPERPLRAYVARTNRGSIRVLEKCGFAPAGDDDGGLYYELRG